MPFETTLRITLGNVKAFLENQEQKICQFSWIPNLILGWGGREG